MSDYTTTGLQELTDEAASRFDAGQAEVLALVIAWSSAEPERVGEVTLVPADGSPSVLGRGDEGAGRLAFVRQRPGWNAPTAPLGGKGLSRTQLVVRQSGPGLLDVERVGRCAISVDGQTTERATARVGSTIHVRGQLLLLVVRRPSVLPPSRDLPVALVPPFGEADAAGILGESAAGWQLRERVTFVARADTHVLILGESGTGKELVARAIHAQSGRAHGPFIARSAATLPAGLIDAELFGNVRNYPNVGMGERPGLIGQADGGTLFLDEVGELPSDLQAHLLRVLDSGGEYHRLGEASARRSRLRLVAATNRPPTALKHDFAARLTLQLKVPSLDERRDDIPLLSRHLLRLAAAKSPGLAARFVESDAGQADRLRDRVRIEPDLLDALLRHSFPANVRELDALLWQAMADSDGDTVMLSPTVRERLGPEAPGPTAAPAPRPDAARPAPAAATVEPDAAAIRAALAASGGSVTEAARALGLTSRFALYRLMRKHGVEGARRGDDEDPEG